MIRCRVVFAELAVLDLIGLHAWVEEMADADVADAYQGRIEAKCAALANFPRRGTPRDALGEGVRSIVFERRIMVLYRVDEDGVTILRAVSGARDLSGVFGG